MKRRAIPWSDYFLLDVNGAVRLLILSDAVWGGAIGMLGPIFALFIEDFIVGATAATAGTAAAIYLVTKSLAQIPAASIIDKIRGEKDDYYLLVWGSIIAAAIPILYLFVNTPMQLFAVQFFYGLVMAITFPSYMAIFTRHIDKGKEGTEWGVYYTITDLSAAVTASVGGYIAATSGFRPLIVVVTLLSILGVLLLIFLRPYLQLEAPRRRKRRRRRS